MNINKWFKIAAAVVTVAPELIHIGKQAVTTVKGALASPSPTSTVLVDLAADKLGLKTMNPSATDTQSQA